MTGCLTLIARLGRDNAGNTLAIAAASLIPMMALIGGGVDISRAYMAKTQLQSACDAGVLAGRKAMSKSGFYRDSEKLKAISMFNFNFNGSTFGMQQPTLTTSDNEDGQVLGSATAAVPTLIMKIFGKDTVDLSVNCMAELQIGNADIMFVLDNTTSMLYAPEDVNMNGQQYTVNDSRSKFYALKEAVKDFHKTINTSVTDSRTRIRYGFVPYAMTVNVNGLLTDPTYPMPSSYISDETDYQTRRAEFKTPYVTAPYTGTAGNPVKTTEYYLNSNGNKTKISSSNCTKFGNNTYPNGSAGTPLPATGGPAPTPTVVVSYSSGGRDGNGSSEYCWRNKSTVTTTYVGTTWYEFTRWIYEPRTIDTSTFKTKGATRYATDVTRSTTPGSTSRSKVEKTYDMIELAAASASGDVTGVSTSTDNWNTCIEERQTVNDDDFDPVPGGAYDLNFDLVPSSKETRWKPMWHAMYFERSGNQANYYFKQSANRFYGNKNFTGGTLNPPTRHPTEYCPAEMKLLSTDYAQLDINNPNFIPTALTNYLATLQPAMYTYHDIGMIWGGRLMSPTGLFKANVNLDADKINVSRHIIFMTDGQLQPMASEYAAWGIENYDHRIAPDGEEGDIYNRHMSRFVAMCDQIKAQGTTIWVIAFGTTMTTQLQNCASDGRAYYSSNTEALRNTFKFIAAQVADLRLGA